MDYSSVRLRQHRLLLSVLHLRLRHRRQHYHLHLNLRHLHHLHHLHHYWRCHQHRLGRPLL